ncbi:MAG: BspA family leucine-rich repeat surface protein, partial [Clostridiales bacterium]|nr:BspA family leucine-rich repeat surface protein [Clostridiales bacterium]
TQRALSRRMRGEALPCPVNERGPLWDIVKKATSPLPEDRYRAPEEMRAELELLVDKSDTALLRLPGGGPEPETGSRTATRYSTEPRVEQEQRGTASETQRIRPTPEGRSQKSQFAERSEEKTGEDVSPTGNDVKTQRPQGKKKVLLIAGVAVLLLSVALITFSGNANSDARGTGAANSTAVAADANTSEDVGAVGSMDTADIDADAEIPTKITLSHKTITLAEGESVIITATTDVDDWEGSITWGTSDQEEAIFTVTALSTTTAKLSYVGEGRGAVSAVTSDVVATCQITCEANSTKTGGVMGDVGSYYDSDDSTALSLDGVTAKKDITKIYFLDTLADAPEDAADLSEAGDGGVLCWTEGTIQYIAGEGGVVACNSCANMFNGYDNLAAIFFLGCFDTSNVTDMSKMFYGCNALTTLSGLSDWDTSSVTDMYGMFANCEALTSLNYLSGWNTSNVTDMSLMFSCCFDLAHLDLSGWDTSSVTDMSMMFCACESLTSLDLSGWDTSNVTDMSYMFEGCYELTTLNLSGWDTSNMTDMSWMFGSCFDLAELDLSGWDTSRVTDMSYMFYYCSSLTDFDPDWLDTSNADTTGMYDYTKWG